MGVPWQQIASSVSSLVGNAANYLGAKSAASKEQKNLRRAQKIQQQNYLMNLDMYDPNRALGYGAMSDLATLYGYTLPEYATSQQLAADTTPLSPKVIKQYLKSGMSLEDISKLGTLTTPNAKQLKKLRKMGLNADQIQSLMQPVVKSDYQGPLSGDGTTGTAQAGNMSRFFTSPDYQFRLEQGQEAINNSASARTGTLNGNALKALAQFNQNTAAGEYQNYVNRLMGLAGIGTQAQGQISQVGTNTANNNSNYQSQIGDAAAAGQLGMYGAIAQHAADLGNIWGSGGVMGGQTSSGVNSGANSMYNVGSSYGSTPFSAGSWDNLNAGSSYSSFGPYASGYQFPSYAGGY